jgi:hypothetical protein
LGIIDTKVIFLFVTESILDTQIISSLAKKYGLPSEIVQQLAYEMQKNRGEAVRFDIEYLGGKGRWKLNQSASVGNGFDVELNNFITDLCSDLSDHIRADAANVDDDDDDEAPTIPSRPRGNSALDDTIGIPPLSLKPNVWWPEDFGDEPDMTGHVGEIRYAYFPQRRRLVLRQGLRNRIFDTANFDVQEIAVGTESGFFNLVVLTSHGDFRLGDFREVAT